MEGKRGIPRSKTTIINKTIKVAGMRTCRKLKSLANYREEWREKERIL